MGVKVIWIPSTTTPTTIRTAVETAVSVAMTAVKKNIHYHYNILCDDDGAADGDGDDGGPFFNSKVFAAKHIK